MATTTPIKKRSTIKYLTLADGLRDQIQRGDLKPGDRLPSFAEMYQNHNMSRTTVERVHRVLEQDGLIVREQGRGIFVASKTKRTGLIGVSCTSFDEKPMHSYWMQVLDGLRATAIAHDQGLVLLDHRTFAGWDKVDGMVVADSPLLMSKRVEKLTQEIPCVFFLSETSEYPWVGVEDYQGGRLATEHLLDLGHRRIACILDKDVYPGDHRFAGFQDALKQAGVNFDERWCRPYSIPGQDSPDFRARGKEIMQTWMSEEWHELECTALIIQNDLVALGVMEALQQAGISVPGQVSIVGYDDLELCNFVDPGLTSVHVPLREIGVAAIELLFREIETGRKVTTPTLLPVRLQRRQSTSAPSR